MLTLHKSTTLLRNLRVAIVVFTDVTGAEHSSERLIKHTKITWGWCNAGCYGYRAGLGWVVSCSAFSWG